MSSFVTYLLFVIVFIQFAMGGLPGWCDPHPPVPGAIIRPSGPIRDREFVVITCFMGSNSAGRVTFTKTDACVDGKWIPGVTHCDDQLSWQFMRQPAH